ncbi:hemolysin activation/secretion protein, partial [Variovorax sp. 3319]|nr:hemolysin activation/secretion protein [Variovorax sp. 3319]
MVHSWSVPRRTRMALAAALAVSSLCAVAQQTPTTPQSFVEQQRQQERERALREQNERTVDQRPQAAPPAPVARIPETEVPCFRIDRVLLVGEQAEAFQWAVSDLSGPDGNDSPVGRCLGTAGVNVVLARAQQAAIARGFVTTRVLAAPQDLSTGTLTLSLVPGRIAAIRLTPDSSPTLLGSGALLGSAIP